MKRLLYIIAQQLFGSNILLTDNQIKVFLLVLAQEASQHYTPFVFIAHYQLRKQTLGSMLRSTRNLGKVLVTFPSLELCQANVQ